MVFPLTLLLLVPLSAPQGHTATGLPSSSGSYQTIAMTVGGYDREYLLYVPRDYDGTEAWPLVIGFHGWSWSPESHAAFDRMDLVADTAHFLIAYPAGLPIRIAYGTNRGWNVDGSFGDWDDVMFVDRLIDDVSDRYNVNLARVHATGYSFGSMMAHALACRLSHRIASIGSMDGPLPEKYFAESCPLTHPLSVMEFHGTEDTYHPYSGVILDEYAPRPVPETYEMWAKKLGCWDRQASTELPDVDPSDGTTVTMLYHAECPNDAEVIHYRINEGGHTWPGYSGQSCANCGKENHDIDATALIWNFFHRHPHPAPVVLPETWQLHPLVLIQDDSIIDNLAFTSEETGFSVGDSGRVYRTLDGGANWQRMPSLTDSMLHAVSFYDADHGWAVGAGGVALRTTTAGDSWEELDTGTQMSLTGLDFVGQEVGFVMADDGQGSVLLATSDGGDQWSARGYIPASVTDVDFLDEEFGAAATCGLRDQSVWITSDSGDTWSGFNIAGLISSYGCALSVHIVDRSTVWVAGWNSLAVTRDGGATWARPENFPNKAAIPLYDVHFHDDMNGVAVGSEGYCSCRGSYIYHTQDGGHTWTAIHEHIALPVAGFHQAIMTGKDKAIIAGATGGMGYAPVVMHADFSSMSTGWEWHTMTERTSASPILESHPNPFQSSTTLSFYLENPAVVSLVIHDLLGRQVAALLPGKFKPAGKHSMQFDAGQLSSGTYLVTIEAGGLATTHTLILLK